MYKRQGQGFGENTRAAIVTRGLAETARLATALGGNAETLSGLSGLGDFLLSCTSRKSRNFKFGELLGTGHSPLEALKHMQGVVEGFHSAKPVFERANKLNIDPSSVILDLLLKLDQITQKIQLAERK